MIRGFGERLRNLPIRQKLRAVFILTTGIALGLVGLGIIAADAAMFYRYLRSDLATFVRVIGDNSSGALAFDDSNAAAEILTALRAKPHVENACLYQKNGNLLATYKRTNSDVVCHPDGAEGVHLDHWMLLASHEISLDGRSLGKLVIHYDLDEMIARVEIYGATVLLAMILASFGTIALSARLRAIIAEPILQLTDTARAVSESKDYSIRAKRSANDELGILAEALNQMMEGIQSRDSDLRTALLDQQEAVKKLAEVNAELQRSNGQLAHSNAELGRSNSDLERFAFMASHDLQEPLRMITAYSQLLIEEHVTSKEKPAELVRYIVGGTTRMRELLADLLAYTEISGFAENPAEPVELDLVLQRVQDTLRSGIEETKAQITSDPLPVIYAHPGRMTSLFQNLVGNSLKYRGQEAPRIRVSVTPEPDRFVFAVVDNGIGIDRQYHDKIFVAFQRLHGKEIPGTGIGLAICQRVIDRYGGRIWVESEVGCGATFWFTLPKSMAHGSNGNH